MKDVAVFICEDNKVRQEIIEKYFEKNKITYCALVAKEKRELLTQVIDLFV